MFIVPDLIWYRNECVPLSYVCIYCKSSLCFSDPSHNIGFWFFVLCIPTLFCSFLYTKNQPAENWIKSVKISSRCVLSSKAQQLPPVTHKYLLLHIKPIYANKRESRRFNPSWKRVLANAWHTKPNANTKRSAWAWSIRKQKRNAVWFISLFFRLKSCVHIKFSAGTFN